MPTAEDGILYYEAGQNGGSYVLLTDQGDFTDFKSAVNFWSKRSGYAPVVRPNGVVTGLVVTPAASGTNDLVDVSAGTVYLAGVLTTIAAQTDVSLSRGVTTDIYRKNSLTINSAGTPAVVLGTDHTATSDVRGAVGGPPWIPTGSIEYAQVHFDSVTAAAVVANEIKQVVGTHQERYDCPTWIVEPYDVAAGIIGYAGVKFNAALGAIHSDDAGANTAGKKVYVNYYTPTFAEVPQAAEFVRPGNSYSVASKQIYGGTLGSSSAALGAGSFTAYLLDGVTDGFLLYEGDILLFKFYPDRLKTEYILCQGKMGIVESYPADDSISVAATIAAETAGVRVTG